jgi:hypothetical protein
MLETLKVSSSQTIDVDKDLTSTQNLFQQSLEKIGSYKDTSYNGNCVILKGKSRYGLQGVPLFIQLDKISDEATKVTIGGKSDDIGGVGAKKCIERLISTFNTLNSGNAEQVEALESTPGFENKTGFSKKKLFWIVALFIAAILIVLAIGLKAIITSIFMIVVIVTLTIIAIRIGKSMGIKPTYIIIGAVVITPFVLFSESGSSSGTGSVRQSPWDNSVDCVEYYLKHKYLRDPDSYDGVSWSKVQKNNDGTYSVTHTFRARNGFGGMGQETLTFTIASDGWTILGTY